MEKKTSIKLEEKKFETNISNSYVDSETELCVAHTLSLLRSSIPQKNSLHLNQNMKTISPQKINCDLNDSNTLKNLNAVVTPLYLEMREENDNLKNVVPNEEINSDTASSSLDLSSNPNSVSPINGQSSENHHQPILSIVPNSAQEISNISQINCNNQIKLLPDYLPQLNTTFNQKFTTTQNLPVENLVTKKSYFNKTKEKILLPHQNQQNEKKKNNKKNNLITCNSSIPQEISNNSDQSPIFEGARFYSFDEFRTIFMKWREQNYHPFRVASSETLRTPEDGEVYEDFKYRYIVYHCAYYGRPRQRGNGKRPNQNYLPCGCKAMLRLNFSHCDHCLKITTLRCEHNGHAVSASSFARVCAKIRKTTNKPNLELAKKSLTLKSEAQLNSLNTNNLSLNYTDKSVKNNNLYYNFDLQNLSNYSTKENTKIVKKSTKKQRFSSYQHTPNNTIASNNFQNHLENNNCSTTIENKVEKNYFKSEQLNEVDGLELSIMAVAAAMSSSSAASSMGSPSTSTASAKSDQISSNLSSSSSTALKSFELNTSNDVEMTNFTISTSTTAPLSSGLTNIHVCSPSNSINQNTLNQVFCDLVNQNCFQNKNDQKNNLTMSYNSYPLQNSNTNVKPMLVSPNVSLQNSKNSLNEILNNKNDFYAKSNGQIFSTTSNQMYENLSQITTTSASNLTKNENCLKKFNINSNGMNSFVNSLNYSTKFASNAEQQQILSNILSSVTQSQQQQKQQHLQNNLNQKKEIVGVIKPINNNNENFMLNSNNINTKMMSQMEEQQSTPNNKNNLTSLIQEILDSAAKNNNIINQRQFNQQVPSTIQQPTFPMQHNTYALNNNKDSLFQLLNQNSFSKSTTNSSLPTISTALANLLSISQQSIYHGQQQNLIQNVLDNVIKQQTDKIANNNNLSALQGLQSIFSHSNLIDKKLNGSQILEGQANLFVKKSENNDVLLKAYEEGEHLLRKIQTYLYKTKNAPEFVDRLQKLVSLIVDIDKEIA